MGVADDRQRLHALQLSEHSHGAVEHRQSLEVSGVADVLTHPGAGTGGDACGGLQLAADRDHRRRGHQESDGKWCESAASSHGLEPGGHDANYGVVARDVNSSVMMHERVGDCA